MLAPRQFAPIPKPKRKPKAQRKPLKRSRMGRVSKKRLKESVLYRAKRLVFLWKRHECMAYDAICAYWREEEGQAIPSHWPQERPHSEEIHHRARRGKNYLNENTWLACSSWAHRWIHDHPKEARALGLLV